MQDRVKTEDDPGFIYLLFEHKSYKDGLIHLQLFWIHEQYLEVPCKTDQRKTAETVLIYLISTVDITVEGVDEIV